MTFLKYLFISFAILVSANAQNRKPEWIDNPEKNYPNSQYLSTVGTGDSRKEAENSAASNLSKIFQSKIKSEETINARYQELMKSNQSSLESQTNVNKNISVSSEQTLFNVRYPESYTDNLGRVYVLGIIEREPTAAIYKNKINDNNSRIKTFVKRYKELKEPVKRYANLSAALVTAKVDETLAQQLKIIMVGLSVQSDSEYSLERIAEMCADAKKEIPFAVNISGAEKDNMAAFINEVLSGIGFSVAEKGILTIKGTESIERIDMKSDQKFVRWNYQLSVFDVSGKAIISFSESGREAHITYGEATARALRTMREKIRADFAKKINSYFDSLVMN